MPNIKISMATLNDSQIQEHAQRGELISEGFSPECVKQACYELRAGKRHFIINDGRAFRIEADEYLLPPHSYLVVVTKERLSMPDNVLGRILAKGHLFSLGVIPVITYADPGFEGYLGITLFNGSGNVIRIRDGQAIAKIEFDRLDTAVARPYRGQHGLSLDVWPVPAHLLVGREELPRYGINGEYNINRLYHGEALSKVIEDLRFYTRWVWVQITVTIGLLSILLWINGETSLVGSLAVGVGGNVATSLLGLFFRRTGIFEKL